MSVLFYILPVMVVVANGTSYRGPAYLEWRMNPTGLAVLWSCRDYGGIGETTMVCAVGATVDQHTFLAAQVGVFAIPANLDSNPTPAQLTAFETALEARMIPMNWLTPSHTWRTALRTILGMFATAGKYAVITGTSILDSGITLNMQFRNFPTPVADALQQVAVYMGYPWAEVRPNWTTRTLFKWFADQWPNQIFKFGDLGTI